MAMVAAQNNEIELSNKEGNMENENKKITLPKELQIKMLKFFMKTSIPRKKQSKDKSSIEK